MDKEFENKISSVLMDFIKEMHDWEIFCNEIDCNKEISFEEKFEKQKEKCKIIFEKYCTQKDRKQERPNIICYDVISYGSEYNENVEKIIKMEQENKNKVVVYTLGKNKNIDEYMYLIINKNGNWLIDSKKRYSCFKNKWVNDSL